MPTSPGSYRETASCAESAGGETHPVALIFANIVPMTTRTADLTKLLSFAFADIVASFQDETAFFNSNIAFPFCVILVLSISPAANPIFTAVSFLIRPFLKVYSPFFELVVP